MEPLKITNSPADKQFKTNPPADFLAAFSERIADEIRTVCRPEKNHLIPETVKLTLRLNELKNQMRSGGDDNYNRSEFLEYLRISSALYQVLKMMGIPPTRPDTGIFSADLCHAARSWVAACMNQTHVEQYYSC
jgi:hypothetical protein